MNKLLLACIVSTVLSTNANAVPSNFFYDRERGWFWFETLPESTEKQDNQSEPIFKSSESTSELKSDMANDAIVIGVEWLRENLPKLQDLAIEQPTELNLKNYAYAQRLSTDYASRFSTKMMQFMSQDPLLSEERRRPTSAFALSSFNVEREVSENSVIADIAKESHIWFFYRADCPYCHKQIPILQRLEHDFGFKILAVSMDGLPLPNNPGWSVVVDENLNMARQLEVVGTPSLFLVSNDKKFRYPLTSGLQPLDRLTARLSLAGKETGLIDEEEYNRTRYVNEENVLENEKVLAVSRAQLEKDPEFLAKLLREKLKQQLAAGL